MVMDQGVQVDEQLAHAGDEGDFGGLAPLSELLVVGLDDRIDAGGGEGRHVQLRPNVGATAPDRAASAATTRVVVIRRYPDQGRDLPAIKMSQLGQLGDQRAAL